MSQGPLKVRVVLPTYNEASRIAHSVDLIGTWLKKKPEPWIEFDWVWVNDGSRDESLEALYRETRRLPHSRVLTYENNQGKGYACRVGVLDDASSCDVVIFTDADMAIPLDHLVDVAKIFRAAPKPLDLVLGVRKAEENAIHQSRRRNMMTLIFRAWVRFRLGLPFTDTQCGFKAFSGQAGKELFRPLRSFRFDFDVEILMRSQLRRMAFQELPVGCDNKGISSVRIFRDSFKMLLSIERFRRERQELGAERF